MGTRAKSLMTPRLSSAVLLRRKKNLRDQVFLVERNPKLRFFGGYLAFPGGVVGKEELGLVEGDRDMAVWRCALRELFEETGVLSAPGKSVLTGSERIELRDALLRAERHEGLVKTWEDWACSVVENPFRSLGWMTTPAFAPLRYETLFLDLELPEGEDVSIVHGELVGGRFWEAGEALEAWRSGEIRIVPPVLLILELMEAGNIEDLDQRLGEELGRLDAGKLHPVRFTPGIFTAPLRTPTLPPATTTNTLLVGEDTIYIVDPGTHEEAQQDVLHDKLRSLVQDGKSLTGILLTHSHNDHVGAVRRTAETFALPILAHEISLSEMLLEGLDTRALKHGDLLDLGIAPDGSLGWQLEAIHTPGHHPGHLCFQENRYHALIAGDMVSTVSTILIDPPEGHLSTYLASLCALLERPEGTLYPAHGPAALHSHSILNYYQNHRKQREEALIESLTRTPRSLDEAVLEVYDDVDPSLHRIARRSLLAGLHKLEEEGRVLRDDERWRLS